MIIIKKYALHVAIIFVVVLASIFYLTKKEGGESANESLSNEPQISASITPSTISTARPGVSPKPVASGAPQSGSSTGGSRGLISSPVPWDQLTGEASCELKGEIKYINPNTYDNQDALFTYKGIDHPGRGITWVVAPDDGLIIGPNLFAHLPLPDGTSLIGVSLPDDPHYKKYELTASINYGRLVDGNVKVMTEHCLGKTTIVLP